MISAIAGGIVWGVICREGLGRLIGKGVLNALRRGLKDKSAATSARTPIAYVHLVYGRQLQQPADEQPADPLDVSATSREHSDVSYLLITRHRAGRFAGQSRLMTSQSVA